MPKFGNACFYTSINAILVEAGNADERQIKSKSKIDNGHAFYKIGEYCAP
jgi:hypothetical protein